MSCSLRGLFLRSRKLCRRGAAASRRTASRRATAAKLSGQQAVLAKLAKKAEEKAATAAAAAAKAKPETKEEKAARHAKEEKMKRFFRKMGSAPAGGMAFSMSEMSAAERMREGAARGLEREINAMYGKK